MIGNIWLDRVICATIAISLLLAGIYVVSERKAKRERENQVELESITNVIKNFDYVTNIRYKGYNETEDSVVIENLFNEALGIEINGNLKGYSEDKFISYEDKCKSNEEAIAEAKRDTSGFAQLADRDPTNSDQRLKTVNGNRGFFLSDLEVINHKDVMLCGVEEYIDVDTNMFIGGLVGNEDYNFSTLEYFYYKTLKGIKKLIICEKSNNSEMKMEFNCTLDDNYKIVDMNNPELLYSKLVLMQE